MRTTVDLPADIHQRARELAAQRHQSLSATLADLTILGLRALEVPVTLATDPTSGLPTLTLGRSISSGEVAEALDDQ